MKLFRILAMVVLTATLASCVDNEQEFASVRSLLHQRPDIQSKGMAKCVSRIKYSGMEMKRYMAGFAHTDIATLPETVCRRMLKGFLSGRMKWEDYQALTRGPRQRFTPNMVRIIRAG